MTDTIPDIIVSPTAFVDVNTLSGLIAGTPMVLTNKSNSNMLLQIAVAQPSASSLDGETLTAEPWSTSIKLVTAGENTIWAKSVGTVSSRLSVQDDT